MADLESFFAKKDKKKKSRKIEITPEELLKKIEQAQKEESVEVETQGNSPDNGYDSNGDQPPKVSAAVPSVNKEDEEWEEFEGELEVDISTLKIQNLGEMEKERQEVEDQEELQKAVEESKSTMKWNIIKKEESSDDEEEADDSAPNKGGATEQDNDNAALNNNNNCNKEEPKAAPAEASAAPANKRYVPPAMRQAQSQDFRSMTAASGPMMERASLKRNPLRNQKIDVNSTDQFPSLGMAVQNNPGRGLGFGQDAAGSFTSVRKGARNLQESTPDQKGLSTSNKFSVLKSNRT